MARNRRTTVSVYVEAGGRRPFSAAYDWPGWCRAAKDEAGALAALADYAERYRPVARAAGLDGFPAGEVTFRVLERPKGGATTDFGAPEVITDRDHRRLTGADAGRQCRLLEASWSLF